MRLTRLEIFGFKSFVERFVLNFDKNMIGIVGPNGCGKSNIVDALRWVLGETHAKHLRGGVLEDLIFNGSESRRPLGMAEVTITICPSSGWTDNLNLHQEKAQEEQDLTAGKQAAERSSTEASPQETQSSGAGAGASEAGAEEAAAVKLDIGFDARDVLAATGHTDADSAEKEDLEKVVLPQVIREVPGLLQASEIQFTRRLYRSGESEYFINRVPCRLRDMIDVYRVIGLGARGLSIVQQGEIGQFISRKPVERRELLEEAAGISGFRNRMEVASRKLEKTSENMDRLRDIMEEVEKQVRGLKRQATRARERNELKANILREDVAYYRGKRVRLLLQQSIARQELNSLQERSQAAEARVIHGESRQLEIQAELDEFETLIADHRRGRDALQSAYERERSRLQGLELARTKAQSEVSSFGRERDQIGSRRSQLAEEIARLEERQVSLEQQIQEALNRKDQAEAQLKLLQQDESRKKAVEVDLSRAKDAVPEELRQEIAQLEERVGRVLGVESELKELERKGRECREQLDASRKELHGVELQLSAAESEVRSLQKQLEALAEQVTRVTGDSALSENERKKVLLAGMRVPERVQRAVSAILGEKAQYLLSDSSLDVARSFAETLRNNKDRSGRIGVISQPAAVQAGAPQREVTIADDDRAAAPSLARLQECLSVDEALSPVIATFLGQFLFVETLQEAIALVESRTNRNVSEETWVVTASGEVFTPWGWYTTEGKGAAFSFTRRIEEMENRKRDLTAERQRLQQIFAESEAEVAKVQESREALVVERRELSENDRRLSALHRQVLDIERHERDRLLAQSRIKQEEFLREEREAQERLRQTVTSVTKLQQEGAFCGSRIDDIHREDDRCSAQLEQLSLREEAMEAEVQRLASEIERGISLDGDMTMSEFQERCEHHDRELKQLAEKREPLRLHMGEVSQDVSEARRELNGLEEQVRRLSVQEERHGIELEMLREDFLRQHPENEQVAAVAAETMPAEITTQEQAQEALRNLYATQESETEQGTAEPSLQEFVEKRLSRGLESFISTAQEEAQKLRKRMEREGEVDPQSIELYEQEDARLRSMQEQHADLEEAKKILETTIRRLKEISRRRFLETFTAVNEKFKELIPRLFGGGAGHLELINPDDPLTSGVDLMVRPPGKRLGSMELMSGGEKALVAISVMISMFLHRPSPICVLDEVDAPLDEANLERYLGLIREISRSVQFLVITHNKRTMTEADRLIGITMQEKGISTALTVSLEDVVLEQDDVRLNIPSNAGLPNQGAWAS